MVESDIYTVPEGVLFRNFEFLSQSAGGSHQTRSLLLQNKTGSNLQAYVSFPFSKHFRLHVGSEGQSLCSTPPHVSLTVQPGIPATLTVELRVPEDEDLNYVQDLLVVTIGLKVILVTIKAVRQSLDPAGGAQLQVIINALPFWPSKEDLLASCMIYINGLNKYRGTSFQLPNHHGGGDMESLNSSMSSVLRQTSGLGGSHDKGDAPAALVGNGKGNCSMDVKSKSLLQVETPTKVLDVENLYQSGDLSRPSETRRDLFPAVVKKSVVVVQGRIGIVVQQYQNHVGAESSTIIGQQNHVSTKTSSETTSGRSDDQSNNYIFQLGDKYFDSRGRDKTPEVQKNVTSWRLVKCSRTDPLTVAPLASSNASRPFSAEFGQQLQRVGPQVDATETGIKSSHWQKEGDSLSSRSSSLSGSSIRGVGSARDNITTTPPTQRHQLLQNADQSTRQQHHLQIAQPVSSSQTDALAAAMRELGLNHLPPPRSQSGQTPASPSIDMRLRPRSGGMLPAAGRPFSASIRLSRGPSGSGDDDGDLEEDFEARLQRNIEISIPRGSSSSARQSTGVSHTTILAPMRRLESSVGSSKAPQRRPRSAASEAQQGYGDEGVDEAKLQSQIDLHIGSNESKSTSRKVIGAGSKPYGKGSAGGSKAIPGHQKMCERSSPQSSIQRPSASLSHGEASTPSRISGKLLLASDPVITQPAIPTTKPTKDQLRSMQAAWDAL